LHRFYRAILPVFVLILIVFFQTDRADAQYYKDITNHWAQETFEIWLDEGLIQGYQDGTVRPDHSIMRSEFAAIINRAFPISTKSSHLFIDTPVNSWYMNDLQRVYSAGLISGYPDNTFRPTKHISREEAALVIFRLAQLEPNDHLALKFQDTPEIATWSYKEIAALVDYGVIQNEGNFRPKEPITRAEAITMLDKVLVKKNRPFSFNDNSLFTSQFNSKIINDKRVINRVGETVWKINEVENQTHRITEAGTIELGGSRFLQRLELVKAPPETKQNYAMEFTLNIQRMINEGKKNRPMVVIIPRTKDANYKEHYAVTYYMETTPMGAIVANLFKVRWAIVNTSAPSGMEPLAEGYYLLKENTNYKAQLSIENKDEGVHIAFYIDGPTDPRTAYKPVVEYLDNTPYKITSSAAGPAFGMVGEADDVWGHPPIIWLDNIRLFTLENFNEMKKWYNRYAKTVPTDIKDHPLEKEIKYLINRGLLEPKSNHKFEPESIITEAEFVNALAKWSSHPLLISTSSQPLTKSTAAKWIYILNNTPSTDKRYSSILMKHGAEPVTDELHYAFEQGIIGLETDFSTHKLSKAEAALLIMRTIDNGYRLPHGQIKLPSIINHGAVLQRNKPIPIWGTGTSGEQIEVSFRQQKKTTIVKDGLWSVTLDAEPHGGPDTLTIKGSNEIIELTNIKVGEVFVVAGQSNAEMTIAEVNETADVLAKYKDSDQLNFYFANQIMSTSPRFDDKGYWTKAYEWAIQYSSAVGTFFVNKLQEINPELNDVPIGIIRISYGGSTIELFLPDSLMREQGYVQQHDEPIMSGYWNGFMETVVPYSIKGFLYYQGENSTQLEYSYEPLLRAHLKTVRKEFRDPNLPIFLVQLSGYGDNYVQTDIDTWPIIREIQMRTANTMDNIELVTAIDLSDANPFEIHPRDKRDIGERIAYRAMETIYKAGKQPESAEKETITYNNGRYTVTFKNVNGKLSLRDAAISGFEVKTDQGSWVQAEAKVIAANKVEVWLTGDKNLKGVRYGWRNYPTVTLFDELDYPVLPFNSDKDLYTHVPAPKTSEHYIRVMNHFLNNNDAIVNLDRNQTFRMIEAIDGHLIYHEYAISGQTVGDRIAKFARIANRQAEKGTSNTIIKLSNHGLVAGDWIRNNSKQWTDSKVVAIIDEHTFQIEKEISGQIAGDELELYRYSGTSIAMGNFE